MTTPEHADLSADQFAGPSEYLAILRRRWLTVLLVPIAVVAVVVGTFLQRPDTYVSTAEVLILGPDGDVREVNVRAEAAFAASTSVLQAAAATLSEDAGSTLTATQLQEGLEATVDDDAGLVQLRFTSASAQRAQTRLDAIVDAYLTERDDASQAAVADAQTRLADHVTYLQTELDEVLQAHATAAAETPVNEEELALLSNRQTVLSSQLTSASAELAIGPETDAVQAEVLWPASLPTEPHGLSVNQLLAIAVAAGLLLGATAAVPLDRLTTRLQSADDAERESSVAVAEQLQLGRNGTAIDRTADPAGRQLQARLPTLVNAGVGNGADRVRRTITVLSPDADVSAIATAEALALSLAASGRQVRVLAAENLTDAFRADVAVQPFQRAEDLDRIREHVDDLVVVPRPLASSIDGIAFAAAADVTVLAVALHHTRRTHLHRMLRDVSQHVNHSQIRLVTVRLGRTRRIMATALHLTPGRALHSATQAAPTRQPGEVQ